MKNNNKSRIPQFKSRAEEATFWEHNSVSDMLEEFKPVQARFSKNLSEGLHIRLDAETLTRLRNKAKNKGIGPTTLVRMWILEQLNPVQHI